MKRFLPALFLLFAPMAASAQEASLTVIDFHGEIIDQDASPISGVLPLEFRIYADKAAKKTIATEKHFIAIVDGEYGVSLGEASKLKSKNETLYVAVLLDGKELTRQEVKTQQQLVNETSKTVETEPSGTGVGDFKLTCPKGYVVTGIEGTNKNGIQNLKLICSKTV